MADKEERIGIATFKDVGRPDFELCGTNLMTRQEAINKIRVAMHKVFIKQEPAGPLFLNYAEAALNALLGVEK